MPQHAKKNWLMRIFTAPSSGQESARPAGRGSRDSGDYDGGDYGGFWSREDRGEDPLPSSGDWFLLEPEAEEYAVVHAAGEDRSDFQAVGPWHHDFGFAKATEGTGWTGKTFAANWANLKAAGIPRGAYHFFHPALSPVAQAEFFYSTVKAHGLEPGDMLVADVEITVGADGVEFAEAPAAARAHLPLLALEAASDDCHHFDLPVGGAWCSTCRQRCGTAAALQAAASEVTGAVVIEVPRDGCTGCTQARAQAVAAFAGVDATAGQFLGKLAALAGPHNPVLLYTDEYMATHDLPGLTHYPLWVADYTGGSPPPSVHPWPVWTFWQYSDRAADGGDANYFNGDRAALHHWISTYLPVPAPPPPPPPPPANWQAAIFSKLPAVRWGDVDKDGHLWVHQVQQLANLAGPMPLALDGDFGPKTKAAIEAIQHGRSLPVTGQVDARTWDILAVRGVSNLLPALVSQVTHSDPEMVMRIQGLCSIQGHPAKIDGSYGPATAAAVKAVQAAWYPGDAGKQDGVVGPVTWSLLLAHARP